MYILWQPPHHTSPCPPGLPKKVSIWWNLDIDHLSFSMLWEVLITLQLIRIVFIMKKDIFVLSRDDFSYLKLGLSVFLGSSSLVTCFRVSPCSWNADPITVPQASSFNHTNSSVLGLWERQILLQFYSSRVSTTPPITTSLRTFATLFVHNEFSLIQDGFGCVAGILMILLSFINYKPHIYFWGAPAQGCIKVSTQQTL